MSSSSAVISGTGMSVPERVFTNADLEKFVDTSDEWIITRTGIKERRIAEESECLSTFAIEAGRQAMESAGQELGSQQGRGGSLVALPALRRDDPWLET